MNEDVVRIAKIMRVIIKKLHGQFLDYNDMKEIHALLDELSVSLGVEL